MRRLLVFAFCCSLTFAQKPPQKLPSINDAIPKVSMHIAPITTIPEQHLWDHIFHREEEGRIFIRFPVEWRVCKEPPVWVEDLQVRDQRDAHVKIISVTKLGVTLIAPRGHDIAVRISC